MKTCNKCGKNKPESDFVKNKTCVGGVTGTCLTCSNAYCAAWKRKNQNRLAAARRKRYAETEGREVKEREQRRRERAPMRVQCQRLRAGMISRAQAKHIPFDSKVLTVNYLIERIEKNPHCECCRKPFVIGHKNTGKFSDLSPSIDRIRPRLGYVVANIAILCWRCNNLKRDATPSELKAVADWLAVTWGNQALCHVALVTPNTKLTDGGCVK